jgi:hypothetical protein
MSIIAEQLDAPDRRYDSGVVLEEAKIVVVTKIVLNLMEQNGH